MAELLAAVVVLRRLGENLDDHGRVRDGFAESPAILHHTMGLHRSARDARIRIGRQAGLANDIDAPRASHRAGDHYLIPHSQKCGDEDGDRMHGTLDLTDGRLYRRIEVERVW